MTEAHVVERFLQQLAMFGPLALLGAPAAVVLPFALGNSVLGLFEHANVDSRLGPLNHLLMGPENHRLHHSRDAGDTGNFGSATVVWDRLFGSWVRPRPGGPLAVGLPDDPTPRSFVPQILARTID